MSDKDELSQSEIQAFRDGVGSWYLGLQDYRPDGRPDGSVPRQQDDHEQLIFQTSFI